MDKIYTNKELEFLTQEERLKSNTFQCLMQYDISYNILVEAYERYLRAIRSVPSQYKYMYEKDSCSFSCSIKMAIECFKINKRHKPYTIGWFNWHVAELSELDMWIEDNVKQEVMGHE